MGEMVESFHSFFFFGKSIFQPLFFNFRQNKHKHFADNFGILFLFELKLHSIRWVNTKCVEDKNYVGARFAASETTN